MHALSANTLNWNPLLLGPKLLWWIDPDWNATVVSGRVASIQDRKGSGADAVQNTVASRPLDTSAAFPSGTKRVFRTDGAAVCMPVGVASSTDRLVNGSGRVYLVMRMVGTIFTLNGFAAGSQANGTATVNGAGLTLINSSGTSRRILIGSGTTTIRSSVTTGWVNNTWNGVRLQYQRPTITLWRDRTSISTGSEGGTPAGAAVNPFTLGASGSQTLGASNATSFLDFATAFHTRDDLTAYEDEPLSRWCLKTYGVQI